MCGMPIMYRVRSNWTGFQGAPGYTNHYFIGDSPAPADAQSYVTAVGQFWSALETYLPSVVTITVDATVQVQDSITGEPTGTVVVTPEPAAHGTLSGSYSAPTGACITWHTGDYHAGREVVGRTFVVPLAGTEYASDGTLSSTAISGLVSAAAALITATSPNFIVRSIPYQAAGGGAAAAITDGYVADQAAVLRSRRD